MSVAYAAAMFRVVPVKPEVEKFTETAMRSAIGCAAWLLAAVLCAWFSAIVQGYPHFVLFSQG